MNILLIHPQYPDTFWSFRHALRFISKRALHPPLGLLTVAARLPAGWAKRLVDLNVSVLRKRDLEWADFVFLGAMDVQRKSAREVIELSRQAGVKVVAGGPLFTSSPDDFPEVEHLLLGEAEVTLPRFLADIEQGRAERIYRADRFPELDWTPTPLWELLDMKKYASMTIQYSRGCPFNCDFCDITTLFGRRVRTKTARQVLRELDRLHKLGWRGNVFFVDDNFIGNKAKLKQQILPALIEWNREKGRPFIFSTEASINLADDDELMNLMVEACFEGVFIGIETPEEASLSECGKIQNKDRDLGESVKKIQRAGLEVSGGFIVGFDNDSPSVFERQIDFIQKSGIVTAMVGLLNAPRGTALYKRLVQEGRLLGNITGDNTDFSINFVPKMNPEALIDGYQRIISGIYSPKPYYKRVKEYLREHRPKMRKPIRLELRLPVSLVRTMLVLGVKDRARWQYWKLFFWSLFRRPRAFPLAMTYAVYGFHFRRVFEKCLIGDSRGVAGPAA